MARTVLVDLTPLDTPSRARGIGRYVRNLALGLAQLEPAARDGLRLIGLTHLGWSGRYRTTEDLAAFAGSPEIVRPSKRHQLRWAYQRRLSLWRAVRRIQPSLVHLSDPNATPLGMGLTRCPRLVTCLDLIPLHYPDRYFHLADGFEPVGKRIILRRYRSADHVVAISEATRQDLIRLGGISPDRISRVYPAVATERWSSQPADGDRARRARLALDGQRYLLYVGDTDWRKNVEGMLGGLAMARAAGADLTLVLAGKLGQDKLDRLDALRRRYQVASAVRTLGYVADDDLAALYRGAVALLFVSRYEGFGLPVVEAMACGCPVITTHGGSLGEVAAAAAVRVDPEDHQAIGAAILELAQDQDLRATWARRGLARAPSFSLQVQARSMVRLYARLVRRRHD